MLPILGMDQSTNAVDGEIEDAGLDAEDPVLSIVPREAAADRIPLPRSHLSGCQREAAALLALHQSCARSLELGGPFRHAALELAVELLELSGLAVELGEDLHLRPQHLGNYRNRNVVDGAHLVGTQAVDVGQMDGGDEDYRRLLKPRVLANHRRQLESVQLRHADVHQDDRDFLLEQLLECFPGGRGRHQTLAEVGQDRLVAEELGRLIVDQQDVDPFIHRSSPLLAVQPHAQGR